MNIPQFVYSLNCWSIIDCAVHILVQVICGQMLLFLLGKFQEVEFLGHRLSVCLTS